MKKYSVNKCKIVPIIEDGTLVNKVFVKKIQKGGHTHNHAYNAAYTAAFGRHSLRRIPRDKKKKWVRIWKQSLSFLGVGTLIHEIRTSIRKMLK